MELNNCELLILIALADNGPLTMHQISQLTKIPYPSEDIRLLKERGLVTGAMDGDTYLHKITPQAWRKWPLKLRDRGPEK